MVGRVVGSAAWRLRGITPDISYDFMPLLFSWYPMPPAHKQAALFCACTFHLWPQVFQVEAQGSGGAWYEALIVRDRLAEGLLGGGGGAAAAAGAAAEGQGVAGPPGAGMQVMPAPGPAAARTAAASFPPASRASDGAGPSGVGAQAPLPVLPAQMPQLQMPAQMPSWATGLVAAEHLDLGALAAAGAAPVQAVQVAVQRDGYAREGQWERYGVVWGGLRADALRGGCVRGVWVRLGVLLWLHCTCHAARLGRVLVARVPLHASIRE